MSDHAARPLRMLILGAHPDDAEYHAGGLAAAWRAAGHAVRMVSATNGGAGHHRLAPDELVRTRRAEAARAAALIGAESSVWDFPDAALLPTLELRERVIRELRGYSPDIVLTHRTCDYHPDHRALAQAVQDASYLVTVPLVVPDAPFLRRAPLFLLMDDPFTRPQPLRPDIVLDLAPWLETVVAMLACHACQVFDFLPFNAGIAEQVPADEAGRLDWLRGWYGDVAAGRADRYREALRERLGATGQQVRHVEALEVSEYAAPWDDTIAASLRAVWGAGVRGPG